MTIEELIARLEEFEPTRTVELAVGGEGAIHSAAAVVVVSLHQNLILISSEPV